MCLLFLLKNLRNFFTNPVLTTGMTKLYLLRPPIPSPQETTPISLTGIIGQQHLGLLSSQAAPRTRVLLTPVMRNKERRLVVGRPWAGSAEGQVDGAHVEMPAGARGLPVSDSPPGPPLPCPSPSGPSPHSSIWVRPRHSSDGRTSPSASTALTTEAASRCGPGPCNYPTSPCTSAPALLSAAGPAPPGLLLLAGLC